MSKDDVEEWRKLYDGSNGEVWIHEDCEKELKKIRQPKMEAKIKADFMKNRFCEFESLSDLTDTQFNHNEGDQKIDGKDVRISAFKNYQLRIYGRVGSVKGNRAFFASCAVIKKKDGLNPADAKRAADRLSGIDDKIEGAKV